jgi:DNA uptake protein ComE-like DNA-binding protein
MFSWASFLYAGLRGRGRSWLLWAAAYATPWVPLIVFTEDKPGWDGLDYAFLYLTIVWLVSSVHAFLIRPEYLRRIASRRIEQRGEPIARTAPGSGHVGSDNTPAAGWYSDPSGGSGQRWWDGGTWTAHTTSAAAPAAPSSQQPIMPPSHEDHRAAVIQQTTGDTASATPDVGGQASGQQIDVNEAGEDELAGVPQIGVVLAKRIVAERSVRGGFRSVDEMAGVVGIQPHILQRIRAHLTVAPTAGAPIDRPRGRVVDF